METEGGRGLVGAVTVATRGVSRGRTQHREGPGMGPAVKPYTVWVCRREGGWDPIDCKDMEEVGFTTHFFSDSQLRIVKNLATSHREEPND